jgi:hypothetical protein
VKFFLLTFLLIITLYLVPNVSAQIDLSLVNQKVCDRFEEDLNKLAAIMEEHRRREGILETRVAFGGVDTPVESADYQITYAAEALAFQRAQKPSSVGQLKSSLNVLAGKILKAKTQVGKVLVD